MKLKILPMYLDDSVHVCYEIHYGVAGGTATLYVSSKCAFSSSSAMTWTSEVEILGCIRMEECGLQIKVNYAVWCTFIFQKFHPWP